MLKSLDGPFIYPTSINSSIFTNIDQLPLGQASRLDKNLYDHWHQHHSCDQMVKNRWNKHQNFWLFTYMNLSKILSLLLKIIYQWQNKFLSVKNHLLVNDFHALSLSLTSNSTSIVLCMNSKSSSYSKFLDGQLWYQLFEPDILYLRN